jgi:hypothetical protein
MPYEDHDYPRQGSPQVDSTPEELNTAIWKAVQTNIVDNDNAVWADFMKSKGATPPHKISEILKQYRFVQRKVDIWDGRRAPFISSSYHKVNKVRLLPLVSSLYDRFAQTNETFKTHAVPRP